MAGIEELGPGVRITAPWLPGTCIVRVAVQIQNSYLLVVIDDDTNREITREIDGEKLSEVHIVGTGDDDENVSGNPDMFRLAIEAMRLGFAHNMIRFSH